MVEALHFSMWDIVKINGTVNTEKYSQILINCAVSLYLEHKEIGGDLRPCTVLYILYVSLCSTLKKHPDARLSDFSCSYFENDKQKEI